MFYNRLVFFGSSRTCCEQFQRLKEHAKKFWLATCEVLLQHVRCFPFKGLLNKGYQKVTGNDVVLHVRKFRLSLSDEHSSCGAFPGLKAGIAVKHVTRWRSELIDAFNKVRRKGRIAHIDCRNRVSREYFRQSVGFKPLFYVSNATIKPAWHKLAEHCALSAAIKNMRLCKRNRGFWQRRKSWLILDANNKYSDLHFNFLLGFHALYF